MSKFIKRIGDTFEESVAQILPLYGVTNIIPQYHIKCTRSGGKKIDFYGEVGHKKIGIECKHNNAAYRFEHIRWQITKYKRQFTLDEYWLFTNSPVEKTILAQIFDKILILDILPSKIYLKAGATCN